VDPLVDETGQPYAYTGDDPVNGVDPSGLMATVIVYVYLNNNNPYYVGQTGQDPGVRRSQAESEGRFDPNDGDGEVNLITVPKGPTANAVEQYVMDELDTYTGRKMGGDPAFMTNRQSVGPLPPNYRSVAEAEFAKDRDALGALNTMRGTVTSTCEAGDGYIDPADIAAEAADADVPLWEVFIQDFSEGDGDA
jgi:hypothetical protein